MVFQALNKLKWGGDLGKAEIVIVHRGAPGDVMTIKGTQITELKKHHFMYMNREGEEVFIPLHRVLEVKVGGEVVWERRKGK